MTLGLFHEARVFYNVLIYRNIPGVSTVSLSAIDIKPMIAQVNLPHVVSQQTNPSWSPTGTLISRFLKKTLKQLQDLTFHFSSSDAGWSTIKWEAPNIAQKTSTINTAGLQFVSAQPIQTQTVVTSNPHVIVSASSVQATPSNVLTVSPSMTGNLAFGHSTPINVNVIHGGRKTNPIIESFKCELCNQVTCYLYFQLTSYFTSIIVLESLYFVLYLNYVIKISTSTITRLV